MIALLLALGFFATAIPMSKYLLLGISPLWYVAIRMTLAGSILLSYAKIKREKFSLAEMRNFSLYLIAITIILTLLPNMLKAYALKYLTSSKASFFQMLNPFFSAFFAYLIFGQKLTMKKMGGIFFGCVGFYILMIYDAQATLWQNAYLYPCLAGFLAVILIRLGLTMMQDAIKRSPFSPTQINGMTMLSAGIVSLCLAMYQEPYSMNSLSVSWWVLLGGSLYIILIGTVMWANFYGYCLQRYSVTLMALAEFSTPLFVTLYGWLLFDEPITINFFIASACMFLGLYVFYYDELAAEQRTALHI